MSELFHIFLIFINDITYNLSSNCLLYADDTLLFDIVDNLQLSGDKLNNDLDSIGDWAKRWLVTINPNKTKCGMTISSKRYKPQHPQLFYNNMLINEVSIHKHFMSCNLSWRPHILSIYEKASKMLNFLKGIQFKVSRDTLMKLYKSLIRPIMEYADVIWDGCNEDDSELIESVQYETARMVTDAMRGTSRSRLLHEVAWEEMKIRRKLHKLVFYFILFYFILF